MIPVSPNGSKVPTIKWEEYMTKAASEAQVREWFVKGDVWLGGVMGRISGLCVIDIDTPRGEEAMRYILGDQVFLSTPQVKTQGGGKHLYFAHPGDRDVRNKTRNVEGCDFRGDGGYVVLPPSPGYEWLQPLDEYDLQPLPQEYIELLDAKATKEDSTKYDVPLFAEGRRDNDLYTVALKLLRGGMPEHEVSIVLNFIAEGYGEPVTGSERKKWINAKIVSAAKRDQRLEGQIATELRRWVDEGRGWWTLTQAYGDLSLREASDKKALRTAAARLVEDGVLERDEKKRGSYRRVEQEIVKIEFHNPPDKAMDLWLPFGLSERVHLYQGNLALLAGEPNSGKTAFLLRFLRENMDQWPIDYYSSEMGASELYMRLSMFDDIRPEQFHFNAIERSFDFHDIINPDRISIIDYMEVLDDFYLVGKHLQKIHEKLAGRKGIAFIAIQKKRGASLGRGAEFGLEKPRLYLSMGIEEVKDKGLRHYLKVEKAKNWVGSINPNGLKTYFKLVDGCRFIDESSTALTEVDALF